MDGAERVLFLRLTRTTLELLNSTKEINPAAPRQIEIMNEVLGYLNQKSNKLPEVRDSKITKAN